MAQPLASAVWSRIIAAQGATFRTVTEFDFTYEVIGTAVHASRTNRHLSRRNFERALEMIPLSGPGEIQHLQGPSYTYAILTDPRVRVADY
jgi:hypothetical protein